MTYNDLKLMLFLLYISVNYRKHNIQKAVSTTTKCSELGCIYNHPDVTSLEGYYN